MWAYFTFYQSKGWHPRQVDELYADEEYWLPVMEAASSEASEIWSEVQQ